MFKEGDLELELANNSASHHGMFCLETHFEAVLTVNEIKNMHLQ